MKESKVGWRIGELEVTKRGCMVVFDAQSKLEPVGFGIWQKKEGLNVKNMLQKGLQGK